MSRYKFEKLPNHKDAYDTSQVILEFDAVTLEEMCIAFAQFLNGCGYHFDGEVSIISSETDESVSDNSQNDDI